MKMKIIKISPKKRLKIRNFGGEVFGAIEQLNGKQWDFWKSKSAKRESTILKWAGVKKC